ncbi:Arabinogalactan peptide 22 [Hibiscus syriacus]|uniref:Arabinogalactan peptide 22 n=1 Tax=Hibiscus syriacus TaxID=106335 RepID=A0A6A2X4S2_HIBSY|nr:Arabinogalactan peptide 22 [Hibiscus syriacus]
MGVSRVSLVPVLRALVVVGMTALPAAVQAQPSTPAPAPTSDGTSIDQGIAYVLMVVALALTYLIHAADLCFTF